MISCCYLSLQCKGRVTLGSLTTIKQSSNQKVIAFDAIFLKANAAITGASLFIEFNQKVDLLSRFRRHRPALILQRDCYWNSSLERFVMNSFTSFHRWTSQI